MRITFKSLESMVESINQEKKLTFNNVGFLVVRPSYEYYELVERLEENTTKIRQLKRGTTKDIYDYINEL